MNENSINGPKLLIIMGAGAFARETLWAITESKEGFASYSVLGFLDDDELKRGKPVLPGSEGKVTRELRILGSLDYIIKSKFSPFDYILPAIGLPEAKKKFTERVFAYGCKLPGPVIHRSVEIGHDNSIGNGTIIFANTSVTCNTRIGIQVTINPHCTIAHDVQIDNFSNLSPNVNLTGNVHLEEGVNIGAGAVILPKVKIGCWSVIGAGAVVTEDIPPFSTAVGIPAKVTKSGSGSSS